MINHFSLLSVFVFLAFSAGVGISEARLSYRKVSFFFTRKLEPTFGELTLSVESLMFFNVDSHYLDNYRLYSYVVIYCS